ncbi:DUF116 domain-containing protein [Clostridium sp. D2Q-14]|uniref:DUF116 domain-containing protein n=1 Tax=Anaeromonas gelatinilytica TaxID=2683194 RepID=UPI00193C6AC8|nr:DUF116 domain-containing protein [Anaeromonas gelatinilytica]MBS4536110.1 DUF116 domain-containing protein [Anaeromonas gelatinilytica]
MKEEKSFILVLSYIVLITLAILISSLYIGFTNNTTLINSIILLVTFVFSLVIINILLIIILIIKLFKKNNLNNIESKILYYSVSLYYPLVLTITKITKIDKNKIRLIYTKINNLLIQSKNVKLKPEELLILLPHCLQWSECQFKITNDIDNCRKCGKCDIHKIIELKDKYDVNVAVATGGTLARKWIKETKPKAIVAVACERDLSSGISDVRGLPVIGVVNDRPNGPCINTKVSIEKLEDAIKFFIKGE